MLSSSDVEKKIQTFHTIEDIVNAMKAYAGANIRRTEDIVLSIRSYENNVLSALGDLIAHYPGIFPDRKREGKRILASFGSSQGLCGPFNEKIADAVSETISGDDALFVIGRKLKSAIEARHIAYKGYSDSAASIGGIRHALKKTAVEIMEIYKSEEYYNLSFIFTFISMKKAEIFVEKILPPDAERMLSLSTAKLPPLTYIEPEFIFPAILEEFLYISLYRCYVESLRSENWHRMRSMEGASENLKKRLVELDSIRNYARQEEITEEMMEILGSGMFYGKTP